MVLRKKRAWGIAPGPLWGIDQRADQTPYLHPARLGIDNFHYPQSAEVGRHVPDAGILDRGALEHGHRVPGPVVLLRVAEHHVVGRGFRSRHAEVGVADSEVQAHEPLAREDLEAAALVRADGDVVLFQVLQDRDVAGFPKTFWGSRCSRTSTGGKKQLGWA